jgi:hypothetical protein
MLAALEVLRKGIQQRGNSDVFKQRKAYENMAKKITEDGNTLFSVISKMN